MYTTAVLFALAGYVSHAAIVPETPRMLSDYDSALRLVQNEKKPMAVFIGSGPSGWDKIVKEGELGNEVKKTLDRQYVCVYIDTSDDAGRQLASSFRIQEGPGLVISDSAGESQAFRHEGELSTAELDRYLVKYADPERLVQTTETPASERSYSAPVQNATFVPGLGVGCSH